MKFEWEVIHEKRGGRCSDVTLRAKVIAGWIVKSVYVEDTDCCGKNVREHALVFVADPRHLWEV